MSDGDGTAAQAGGVLARWRNRDHTRGRLIVSLAVLSLPLLISGLLYGAVFQIVDLSFISRLGEAPMAAVIIVNQSLRTTVMMLVMGASFGAQALIARAVGEGRIEAAEQVAGQTIVLGGMLALALAAVGGLFPELLFSLPGPDPGFAAYGVPYVRWAFLLLFGFVGAMLVSGILTGAGDTTAPLFLTLVNIGVALFAEWCLIFGHLGAPALGVRGVALGLAIGQTTALSVGLSVLFRGRARVHLRRRHLRPDAAVLRAILAIAWPPALHMVGSLFLTFAFLRMSGHFGESVQAAYAIGLRLGMIAPAVCFPLATACATLVGQSLGAGDVARAKRAVAVGLLVHGSAMLLFAGTTFFLRREIMALLSDDPEVIRQGSEYLRYASGAFTMWAFYFVFFRSLQGAGDVIVPMVLSLGNTFCVTVPLAYVLAFVAGFGPTGLWMAFLTGSVVLTVTTGLYMATGRWTRRGAPVSLGAPTVGGGTDARPTAM
ncbi:MAG: MATE family efflux transporter [Myxococcales bacterium]|nr:MATE family efflux transporter [Myxococcales bacterium]